MSANAPETHTRAEFSRSAIKASGLEELPPLRRVLLRDNSKIDRLAEDQSKNLEIQLAIRG